MTTTENTTTLSGLAAIDYAEEHGVALSKYSDPTEEARSGLTVDEAREVAAEDASLIYLEVEPIEYTWVLGAADIDPQATVDGGEDAEAAAYRRFCELAEQWLTEHEGDRVAISVRMLRGAEAAGIYRDRGDGTLGQILGYTVGCPEDVEQLTNAAYEAAWEALSTELSQGG